MRENLECLRPIGPGTIERHAHPGRAMPPLQSYNPIVIGFVEGKGAVHIPLQDAQDEYGQLPSNYGLLPGAEGRRAHKALNLPVGLAIMDLFREGKNLPEIVRKFYERWGLDY